MNTRRSNTALLILDPFKGFLSEGGMRRAAAAAASAAAVLLIGCWNDPPAASEQTEGGENALDQASRDADRAHQDFKREVKPAADWVDEKTKKAVGEGKKAASKTADAITEAVSDDG